MTYFVKMQELFWTFFVVMFFAIVENLSVNLPNKCVAKTEQLGFSEVVKTEQVWVDFMRFLCYN